MGSCIGLSLNKDLELEGSHLSSDENAVFSLTFEFRVSRLPVSESHSGVVCPVKQAFHLSVIQSDPNRITGSCTQSQKKYRSINTSI